MILSALIILVILQAAMVVFTLWPDLAKTIGKWLRYELPWYIKWKIRRIVCRLWHRNHWEPWVSRADLFHCRKCGNGNMRLRARAQAS